MFVDPLRRVGQAATAKRTESAAPGFSVPDEGAAPTRATAMTQAATGIDAILALQAEDARPGSRRAKQIARGQRALDALDALKKALVLGSGGGEARQALLTLGDELESTGDSGLDSVLAEIEVRRAVELAKLDMG